MKKEIAKNSVKKWQTTNKARATCCNFFPQLSVDDTAANDDIFFGTVYTLQFFLLVSADDSE